MKNLLIAFALLCVAMQSVQAQTGVLSGKAVDKKTGELLIGVAIYVAGTSTGTTTDLDGNYNMKLDVGTYDIAASYLSYQKKTVTGVEIKAGQVTSINFAMESEATEIKEIVVEAKKARNTDAAIISIQKKSYVIQDGVSAQQLVKTGSSNAAESMKQMTGANVEDGKYMVMRGLGDRYSIAQLNGMNMTSTDPYRNSSPLDLIPSSMLDNIVTLKSFTPDMPGNFAGGLLNITTKSFPDKFNVNFSTSAGFNTQTTFKDFITTPERSSTQFLGYKGKERAMNEDLKRPEIQEVMTKGSYIDARRPNPEFDDFRERFNTTAKSFSNGYVPETKTAPLNYNFNFSLGNRYKLFKRDLGFIVALNHNRDFQNYEDAIISTYFNLNQDELFPYRSVIDNRSSENGQLGGLVNLAYKLNNNNTITFNLLYNNDAEIMARQQAGGFAGVVSDTRAVFNVKAMEFVQRQSITPQIFSKHVFPKLKNAELQLGAGYTASKQDEPSLRYFAYSVVIDSLFFDQQGLPLEVPVLDTNFSIQNAEYQYPFQFVRNLDDKQYQAKADFTLPLGSSGINKLKVGGYFSALNRNFEEYRYQSTPSPGLPLSVGFTEYDGDFEGFFSTDNYGIIDTQFRPNGDVQRYVPGYYYVNNTLDKNFYTGTQTIAAGYVMGIFSISEKLKTITGVRAEHTYLYAESKDTLQPISNTKILDFLPSLNFIYALNEKMNIRVSGTRTIARPNLREISSIEQLDTREGYFFIGNPNLKRTSIWNADLRWELFPRTGELIAISYYYKYFTDPIFRRFTPTASLPEVSLINIDKAFITGAEIEFRKSLDFISSRLADFSISTNFSYIYSRYKIPEDEIRSSTFIDSTYSTRTRPFQGQAPFIINFILSYDNNKAGLESALYFNVLGRSMAEIALFAAPDIYENARPTLNYKISKTFGKYFSVSFAARNLINPYHNRIQTHRGRDFYAERYRLGRTFVVGLGFKF